MKAKVVRNTNASYEYPVLLEGDSTGAIVLMTKQGTGVVVKDTDGTYNVGELYTSWAMSSFKRFDGVIELSN